VAGIHRVTQEPTVLRISPTRETRSVVTLKVEGALEANWLPVLESACLDHLSQEQLVELDFEHVSFIDREAVPVVRELVARGVVILHPRLLVRHLLGEGEAP
jgi:hypothetical protein